MTKSSDHSTTGNAECKCFPDENSPEYDPNQASRYEKRKVYYQAYYQANRERIRAANNLSAARFRLRNKPAKLSTGFKATKWNILAAENKSVYHVETKSAVVGLSLAIRKLGFYAMSYRTNKGFKVLKLRLA